jgi:putative transposase
MMAVRDLGQSIGNQKEACEGLNIPRPSYYRYFAPKSPQKERPKPPLALSQEEEQEVLDTLHSERFQDRAPHEIYATLLDEGTHLCSVRTMYRILDKNQEVKDRRRHVSRTHYVKPELLATAPNQVWSWDITKLKGPAKWTYFYLYVILDIFSRYVVGWMVAERESSSLAKHLIAQTCQKQGIVEEQLIIHADRGASMRSKPVAHLLSDLGVTKTHSRPYTSNDNPYSESQFRTLKYCPEFPERFGSIQDSRSFCGPFFTWYNNEHKHSGLSLLTPAVVHYGQAEEAISSRNEALEKAYLNKPHRFKYKKPEHPPVPTEAWINKPKPENGC